ncbi:MAG: hypothetical protein L0226_07635 [Acidobacteria bacterium]|nr:hypothetical protein [Acidobacteriota bacterium]
MKALNRKNLISMAGERVFKRGEDYFTRRCVRSLIEYDGKITAVVDGTQSYQVSLRFDGRRVGHDCSCPEGAADKFCKHCVAVYLTWLEVKEDNKQKAAISNVVNFQDVHGYLKELPHETLVEFLMCEAVENTRLLERLSLRAARVCRKDPNLDEYRRILEFAAQSAATAEDVEKILPILKDVESSLDNLLVEGYAEEVITLTEEALLVVFGHLRPTDACQKMITAFRALHLKSCRQLSSGPQELAARLFKWQMRAITEVSEDMFALFEQTYFDPPGAEELNICQKLLEAEWKQLESNSDTDNPTHRGKFARLTKLVQRSAERRGDIESLIIIKSHRLKDADSYLEIARLCKLKGESDLALKWASRGKDLFPASEAESLYEFLAAEYVDRKEWEKALEIVFSQFAVKPSLKGYQRIAGCARHTDQWDLRREHALDLVRHLSSRQARSSSGRKSYELKPDQSILVSILLWDNDEEAAWQAAQRGICSAELLLELADRRVEKHPEDALNIYKRLVTQNANRKNNYAYHKAVELLREMARIMRKLKRRDEFISYVNDLREWHRSQRNFVKLIDQMMARYAKNAKGAK